MYIDIFKNSGSLIFIVFIVILLLVIIRKLLGYESKTQYIYIGNDQTIGKRQKQEDSFSTVLSENGVLAVLADGMGGYSNGKMASSIAVNTFMNEFSKLNNVYSVNEFFIKTCNLTNMEILKKSKGIRTGTTVAAVIIFEQYLYWASIGDSALVLFRNGEFINLNKKHVFESILKDQYLSGKISREEIRKNPMRKRLTSFIGHDEFKDIELSKKPIELRKGDKVILCSDGVYNSISELEMEKILMKNIEPYEASEEIINVIENKNYLNQDNATIIILEKNN